MRSQVLPAACAALAFTSLIAVPGSAGAATLTFLPGSASANPGETIHVDVYATLGGTGSQNEVGLAVATFSLSSDPGLLLGAFSGNPFGGIRLRPPQLFTPDPLPVPMPIADYIQAGELDPSLDLDGDGDVDSEDYGIYASGFPTTAPVDLDMNDSGTISYTDVGAFFTAWEAGELDGDFNFDGGVDGGDVEAYFIAWEAYEFSGAPPVAGMLEVYQKSPGNINANDDPFVTGSTVIGSFDVTVGAGALPGSSLYVTLAPLALNSYSGPGDNSGSVASPLTPITLHIQIAGTASGPVPEPASVALLGLSAAALARRRRSALRR